MTRLTCLVGILLVVGVTWSLLMPAQGIFGSDTAPVSADELWRLNFRLVSGG